MQEGIWPNLKPRSSLLGAAALNQLQRDPGHDPNSENRSELASELRMLYKAVGSATERLLVSAIDTEEEQVSQFVRLIVGRDIETGEFIQTRLTLRGMVGQLRRQLVLSNDEGHRQQLAIQLARLAGEGVPGAHPDYWYGLKDLSTTEALAELRVAEDHDNRLELHPSELDNFVKCPLHWFIEAHGGREASITTKVGTLMHEILEQATEFSESAFEKAVDSKWHNLEFDSQWQESAERRRVSRMIVRLLSYLDDVRVGKRRVIAVEEKIDFALAGAWVNGKADRIEIDDTSNVIISDLKTSRNEVSQDDTNDHLQLAVYQLAALNGGFKNVGALESEPVGVSAVLVQIGHKNKDKDEEPIVTSQTALKVEGVQMVSAIDQFLRQIEKVTEGMLLVDAQVAANTGLHCYERNPYGSCSLHLIEQVCYGE
jgi:RecB family exonuclease